MQARKSVVTVSVLAGAGVLGGAGGSVPVASSDQIPAASETPAAVASSPPPSADPTPTPTPTPEPPPFPNVKKKLKLGKKGKLAKKLQLRLRELGYDPGKTDGKYGMNTAMAVWAFQKVNKIKPSSTVRKKTWKALNEPEEPKVLVRKGKDTRVEVNLKRQYLVYYVDGERKLISHVSSGTGVPYCEEREWQGKKQRFCGSAQTPTGDFKAYRKVPGWDDGPLGNLFNPIYFNGGIAFHGSVGNNVPLYPASHGCVRVPMTVAHKLPKMLDTGVPVHVRRPKK